MKFLLSLLPLAAFANSQAAQTPLSPWTLDSIPLLGFGTWNLDRSNATEAVSLAIQTGFRHIDCADAYQNEDLVGKGIADGLAKTGLSRADIWVTSKLWNDQ
jgi:alcohol dehydrogenase (NADP+)